jgi:hypothetical protein
MDMKKNIHKFKIGFVQGIILSSRRQPFLGLRHVNYKYDFIFPCGLNDKY